MHAAIVPASRSFVSITMASLLVSIVLPGCTSEPVGSSTAAVVYGSDDRVEPYEFPAGPLRSIAEQAVAMRVNAGFLDESNPSSVQIIRADTLSFNLGLCPGQPFEDQISIGSCSGTLIDDQHLLTAGHCTVGAEGCSDNDPWLFGLRYSSPGVLAPLSSDNVYRCQRVVAYVDDGSRDHAVVELDRPVVGHTPAPVSNVSPTIGTALTLIGHPNGIPMKLAPNGAVTALGLGGDVGFATVDAFSGNSGAGIFNDAGHLVGVLSGGNTDYIRSGGCNVVNVIDPGRTDGEVYTAASIALTRYCAEPGVTSALCACSGPCPPVTSTSDAGVTPQDGGAPTGDGGTAADASVSGDGGPPIGRPSEGCSCRTTIRGPGSVRALWLMALLGLCLLRRRPS